MKKFLPLFLLIFASGAAAQIKNPLPPNAGQPPVETTIEEVLTSLPPGLTRTDTTTADFQTGTATNVDLTGDPDNIILAKPGLDRQNESISNTGVGITVTTWGGQTFTPSVSGKLTKVDLNFFCSGCTGTTPDLIVSVRAASGGLPTGADLASATISGFSSGLTAFYAAVFATPATLVAGTQYAIVVRPSANPSPGTYALTRSAGDVYAGGTRVAGSSGGTVWSIPLSSGVTTDAGFRTFMDSGFAPSGVYESGLKDGNPGSMQTVSWDSLSWTASTPTGTSVVFQIAASNDSAGPFNFVGPDGTAATFYTVSGTDLGGAFYNNRYLKYKAYFATTDAAQTPVLSDVTIGYSTLGPTAANASVGGRVTTATGRGISAARVTITDTAGQTRTAMTNSSGFYRFADVPAGETYTIGARHKSYRFAAQALGLADDAAEINIIALP